jgi:hypothetical protein
MKAPDGLTIRLAESDNTARIRVIARSAYARYVPRIDREPSPMAADYEGDVAAQRVVAAGS